MKKFSKYVFIIAFIMFLVIPILYYTYALDEESLLSKLNISVDSENNLTTTIMPEIDDFLKNPYKGFSSEDAYIQTTGAVNWQDSVDKYATEGYLRLNWYMFYKNSFVGPTDATDYNDEAYDWSVLYNLIKLYADHNMQLRFGVMTANTTSVDAAIDTYYANSGNITSWSSKALIDLKMPKGSIIPQADYIPVISLEDDIVKLTCASVDCSEFDSSGYDNYTHTNHVVLEDEVVYKARNITPMWMFEGIPSGYDEKGEPIYADDAVKWYLDVRNVQWLPKWDDPNLLNNINEFVEAMADYLKNEEYNGKKLIDYISYVEVRSYGNYGENHIDETSLNSVNDEFRNPLLCGYLDTSLHNYAYAYEKDTNFVYPSDCYFDLNNEKVKMYNGMDWHLSYTDTIKYYVNVSFEYFYENYLKTYMNAFEDTDVRLVFNWFSSWDSDYYYDKGFVANGTIQELLKKYDDYLTIRIDSVFGSNFGEGYQLSQSNGISPTSFEYAMSGYNANYNKEDYFSLLKAKIAENNLCSNKYNCTTEYFVNVVENSRATYMDYNYILYDYYENFVNKVEDNYVLDLDYLGNSLGYHFVMKKASYNTNVDLSQKDENNLSVDLEIVNDGVTYLYDNNDTKVYLALLKTDSNGNVIVDENNKSVVVNKFLTDIKPTEWKSSMDITGNRDSEDSNNLIVESIKLNINNIDSGKYILALGLFTDFDNDYPTIKFGNEGGTIDNWYALGEILLDYSKCNVNYNSNGGYGLMDAVIVDNGIQFKLSKNTFVREGYNFKEWNTKADGSGTSYSDEQNISINNDITLYAIWENGKGTVTFNSNFGDNETKTQDITFNVGTKLSKNTFVREGYNFKEWNTKADGSGISYSDEQTITLTEGITLYAIWEESFDYEIKKYDIDKTNSYISKIIVNTSVDDFKNNFEFNTGYTAEVEYKIINNTKVLYTGGKTKIYKGQDLYDEFTNIVTGDINGDGTINSADLLKVRQHLLNINTLSGIYFLSSDINDDDTINSADLLRVRQHLLGTKPIS